MHLRPGQLLRHYKGGLYLVLHSDALLNRSGSTGLEPVVVYRQLHSGLVFVRDADEFDDRVPRPFNDPPSEEGQPLFDRTMGLPYDDLVPRFTPAHPDVAELLL